MACCRQIKTQDKSHFGVRDLCTGRCNSKDLINSDKTGIDPILLPVLILRVFEIMVGHVNFMSAEGVHSRHFTYT